MAPFLGLEQIWVWVKKLPILFFATSFISFEPKLKMAAVATSISSMGLFSPYTLACPKTHNPQPHKPSNSNSKRKQSLRNPSAPPPRTDDRSKLLHPTLRRRSDVHPHSDASSVSFLPFLLFSHLRPLRALHVPNPPRKKISLTLAKPYPPPTSLIHHRRSQSMGLGFDLWRRSMTDLGLGFEERDVQVTIWVLVVVDLRFWVVTVDISMGSWCYGWTQVHGAVGSNLLWVLGLRSVEWLI